MAPCRDYTVVLPRICSSSSYCTAAAQLPGAVLAAEQLVQPAAEGAARQPTPAAATTEQQQQQLISSGVATKWGSPQQQQ